MGDGSVGFHDVSARGPEETLDVPSLAGRARLVYLAAGGFLAKSRDVQTRVFLGGADPQRGEDVDDAQDHVRPDEGEGGHDDAGQRLDPELAWIPEEQAVWAARVDQGRGEQARGERPPDPAGPVACEDIQRVIERRPRPPAPDVVAEDPGDQPDDDGGHRADISRGGGGWPPTPDPAGRAFHTGPLL